MTLKTTGTTRFRLSHGSGADPRVAVLIHGISYPMEVCVCVVPEVCSVCLDVALLLQVYDRLYSDLTQAGRAVLMYDLTGRGWSHSRGTPMTIAVFVCTPRIDPTHLRRACALLPPQSPRPGERAHLFGGR